MESEGRRYFFADRATSTQCFAASKSIERDIEQSGVIVDNIDMSAIKYYRFAERRLPARAWNVDIRAAYPRTLYRLGMISDETLGKCMKLRKEDRLRAVGMIAGRRFVQEFRDKRLTHSAMEASRFRPYFFAVCRTVGDVMESVCTHDERALLFYWVDGLFLATDDPKPYEDIVREHGYESKSEAISSMKRTSEGRYIFFERSGKRSYICVPRRIEYSDPDLLNKLRNDVPDLGQSPCFR